MWGGRFGRTIGPIRGELPTSSTRWTYIGIRRTPRLFACGAAIPLLLGVATAAYSQGVSTPGIHGRLTAASASSIEGRIRVVSGATGFSAEARTSQGRFFIEGLEPGAPYTVIAFAPGFAPQRQDGVVLRLGELREMNFSLAPLAAVLRTVTVSDGQAGDAHTAGGIGMTIGAGTMQHIPTLNRDLYDFVRLVPQISSKIGLSNPGFSAGGVGFRFNDFLINGVSERTLSGGVSRAFAGGRSIPLDAVEEYQVLLSPYDVRYGNFAGALVNAVTKSGSNSLHGSVFVSSRNDRLARHGANGATTPYDRAMYGFSAGGPIIPNRLHFFIASEMQDFTFPAAGPYIGQSPDAQRPVPISSADLSRLETILRNYGLTAGSAGPVKNRNPLRNIFSRLDFQLPSLSSRVALWANYGGSDLVSFSRAARDSFSLSSYEERQTTRNYTMTAQVHTALSRAGGGHNEVLISYTDGSLRGSAPVQQPIVRVSVPSVSGGSVTVNTGTPDNAQGGAFISSAFTLKENLTIPLGPSHLLTAGAEIESFRIRRAGVAGSYGAWSFPSIDALQLGHADRYDIRIDLGSFTAPLAGSQYAGYVGDHWTASRSIDFTAGVRGDILAITAGAPYRPLVDSIFHRRTDQMPRRRVEVSPRLGFTWNPSRTERQSVRGGVGVFTTRYPLAWPQMALSSYGIGGTLRCSRIGAASRPPPAFNADYRSSPTACGGGATITTSTPGDLDLVDRDLRLMRVARASVAHETRLPGSVFLTNEALVTRGLSDVAIVNLNLQEPAGTDAYGRVIYGSVAPSGLALLRPRSPFTEAVEIRNNASLRSFQLSTRLEKTSFSGVSGSVSYTFSRTRDAQTPTRVNTRGTLLWASARVVSGRHDDLRPRISSNDVPHRLVAVGTYVIRPTRWRTEISFYYVGESGRPFTYTAFGTLGRGDLNADGSTTNDPIYVPRNALDTSEMKFSGISDSVGADNSAATQTARAAAQRGAFENFINSSRCMRRQRARILERNSCREPWSNTTIASVRQALHLGGRSAEVELEVFNALNLLNAHWGLRREAVPGLLEHVGQTMGPVQVSQPVFRFNAKDAGWSSVPGESGFQLQLGVRYRF